MNPNNALSHFKKFDDFREYQTDAIDFAQNSTRPVVAIHAPTGIGKSLIGMCLSQISGNSVYLVHSKALQNQLIDDFPEARVLKGRGNYPCVKMKGGYNCDECAYRRPHVECEEYKNCIYRVEKDRTLEHHLRVLNYPYYFVETNFIGKFSGIPYIVCDEADTLEDAITGFISLGFTEYMMGKYRLGVPKHHTTTCVSGVDTWRDWAEGAMYKMEDVLKRMGPDVPLKSIKRIENFISKAKIFVKYVDKHWIATERKTSKGKVWEFSPTWLTEELTNEYFLKHSDKVVLMSATLPPPDVLGKTLGIPECDIDYISLPSPFPRSNKKIFVKPIANITRKTFDDEIEKLRVGIAGIVRRHEGQKGLIHCVSYKLRNEIMGMANSRYVTHDGKDRIEVLDKFKASDDDLVLVSPSMDRGVSLNDDHCRFIIIAKCPFLYLGDKKINKRYYSGGMGRYWYKSMAAQTIQQMAGRGVRSSTDWCDIYILDEQAQKLISECPELFSMDFRECLRFGGG